MFTLPDVSTFLTGIKDIADPVLTSLLPLLYYTLGFVVAFGVISWAVSLIAGVFHRTS